jgi:hypothetical protein
MSSGMLVRVNDRRGSSMWIRRSLPAALVLSFDTFSAAPAQARPAYAIAPVGKNHDAVTPHIGSTKLREAFREGRK